MAGRDLGEGLERLDADERAKRALGAPGIGSEETRGLHCCGMYGVKFVNLRTPKILGMNPRERVFHSHPGIEGRPTRQYP